MSFAPPNPGDQLSNDQICAVFQCAPYGGMRRSLKTNTLVVTSGKNDAGYQDRWVGTTFYYTGQGREGDQSLAFMQNPTLAESNTNGIAVHLFEVHAKSVYTYVGQMRLGGAPYLEQQPGADGRERKAWVFPLTLVSGSIPPVPEGSLVKQEEKIARQVRRLSDDEVRQRAERGRDRPGQRPALTTRFDRDPYVAEHAKRRAKGVCELCNQPAPFRNADGDPYLETHHIVWLAKGGPDTIENTAALCPNCHRKMHVLNLPSDQRILTSRSAS